jgi:electron transport complex protein RnfG
MNQTLVKYTLILIFVGALSAGILALVYEITLVPIAGYQKANLLVAQQAVLPKADKFSGEIMPAEMLKKFQLLFPGENEKEYFVGFAGSRPAGYIFRVYPRGYAGSIKMLVGVGPDGTVTGVKILEHRETPGLGNHITDDKFKNTGRPFVAQFFGKKITDKIQPKIDIDAITGATISTRGVSSGVRGALELFQLTKKGVRQSGV